MRRLVLTILLTLSLVPAAPALAGGGGAAVIRDCTDDGVLEGHYTQSQLKDALASIPSDVDEYTNCREVIHSAYVSGGRGGGPFGGFGSGNTQDPLATATPAERAAVANAARNGGAPVRLGDVGLIQPGAVGRHVSAGVSDLPTPVLIAAIALLLAAAGTAVPPVRNRVLARRAR
jgi:hypothetical protein